MTDPGEVQTRQLPQLVAAPENEGGAPRRPETGEATTWFVPPLVVPAFLVALIVGARRLSGVNLIDILLPGRSR